jgi:hypothetical protein
LVSRISSGGVSMITCIYIYTHMISTYVYDYIWSYIY